jgi:fumarate hydratase class I
MLKEFGVPEAMWLIEVKDFPVLVTMDSHGNSLHKTLSGKSKVKRDEIFKSL